MLTPTTMPIMTELEAEDSQDQSINSRQFLAEARRQVALDEHGEVISEMENSIGDNLVSGSADNPRLKRVIEALDNDEAKSRLSDAIMAMATYPAFAEMPLQEALIEHSCVLRSHAGTEVAKLQIHIIGVYRRIRELMYHQQSLVPDLHDLRTLPTGRLERLLHPLPLTFGSPSSADALVVTDTQRERILELAWQFISPEGCDEHWADDSRDLIWTRDDEKDISHLDSDERKQAREELFQHRIRESFYDVVFNTYLGRDELCDDELDAHFTLLHWMQQMAETPHLYPFMQGQTASQKPSACLSYHVNSCSCMSSHQRIDRALQAEPYQSDGFADLTTDEQFQRLHTEDFPPLEIDDEFIVSAFLCPFATFARWSQTMNTEGRFLLPGD